MNKSTSIVITILFGIAILTISSAAITVDGSESTGVLAEYKINENSELMIEKDSIEQTDSIGSNYPDYSIYVNEQLKYSDEESRSIEESIYLPAYDKNKTIYVTVERYDEYLIKDKKIVQVLAIEYNNCGETPSEAECDEGWKIISKHPSPDQK